MKVCFKCGETKALGEFYVHKMMADGHLGKCKACCLAYARQRLIENPEAIAASERKRNAKPARKAYALAMLRAARKASPEKSRARDLVFRAIKDGKILRKPCEHCGKEPAHAHHADYSKPLDVTFLCVRCHHNEHRRMREAEAAAIDSPQA